MTRAFVTRALLAAVIATSLVATPARAQMCEYPIADLAACMVRTARAGHTPTTNGCGPDWFPSGLKVPQGSNNASYAAACDKHDVCYETCNTNKVGCDTALENEMKAECRKAYPYPRSGPDDEVDHRGVCLSRAHAYWRAVAGAGQGAYDAAQKLACECCKLHIQYLLVDEPGGTLKLVGSFGSTPGKVTVGGKEASGCTWADAAIVCTLPPMGPGSNGDVVASVEREPGRTLTSNARQLTEWDMTLQYLWSNAYGETGWKFEGSGIFRFRADVAPYDDGPGTTRVFPVRGMVPTLDSSLPLTASGSAPAGSMCSHVLSGSGTFVSGFGGVASLVIGAAVKVDTNARQGSIGLGFGAAAGLLPFIASFVGSSCSPVPDSMIAPTFGLLDSQESFPAPDDSRTIGPLPALYLNFDGSYHLTAKQHTDPSLAGLTVKWGDVAPISPPKL